MGQALSMPEDEKSQDVASSFAAYFKNFKVENKIISQETISMIESHVKKGKSQEANLAITKVLEEIDNAPLNIAVTGESGAGKSSFINALRGVGHEEKDRAPTGVVETTMERTPYTHSDFPNVTIWDLPGIGTTNFQPKTYLEKVKFPEYDFFIIVSATRFKHNDIELAKAIKFMKKNFYFIKTKVDFDLYNEKLQTPTTFDREKVLQKIREECVNNFKKYNISQPQIFLISNNDLSEFDFPILMDTLIKDVPAQKRHCLMLLLPKVTDAAIERKRDALKQYVWLEALKVGLWATLPTGGISITDAKKMKESLDHYRVLFGVDDASLQAFAKDLQVPVEELKEITKSSNFLETETEESIMNALLKHLEELCAINGGPVASGIFFVKIIYLKLHYLDIVAADAKRLLEMIYSRNQLKPKACTATDQEI